MFTVPFSDDNSKLLDSPCFSTSMTIVTRTNKVVNLPVGKQIVTVYNLGKDLRVVLHL